MTITWTPRLHITRNNVDVGYLFLNPVKSEVLPRTGEVVAFHDDLFTKQMQLHSSLSYAPKVRLVEHAVEKDRSSITIVITVETDATVDEIRDLAEANNLNFWHKPAERE